MHAIRRVLIPEERAQDVIRELRQSLAAIRVGDPRTEGVVMGPLVDEDALVSAREGIEKLEAEAEIVSGDPAGWTSSRREASSWSRSFSTATRNARAAIHEVEVFGPVATS
jgi:acyl-CoA reductase-like NAD-dependent aldehyde dehydrogenase